MKKWFLLYGAILSFFLLLETFFWLFYPHSQYSITYAPWGWRHIPNSKVYFYKEEPEFHWDLSKRPKAIKIEYNKYGLRGWIPRGQITNPILCLGDSWLEDMGSPTDNLVTEYLRKLTKYNIINAGCYGFDNSQEYIYYTMEGWKFRPAIVILFYAKDEAYSEYVSIKDDRIEFNIKQYTLSQKLYRMVVSSIRRHSHFGSWLLNRLYKLPDLKKYLIKNNFKESNKPITGPRLSGSETKEEVFKILDASIFLALDKEIKKNGGVLVMLNIFGKWSESQKAFFENCNIRYIDLDYEPIIKARALKEIDLKNGTYDFSKESHRFGYKCNEIVAKQIYEWLNKNGFLN